MESIASIAVTIGIQAAMILIAALSWCFAAFKLARVSHDRKMRREIGR